MSFVEPETHALCLLSLNFVVFRSFVFVSCFFLFCFFHQPYEYNTNSHITWLENCFIINTKETGGEYNGFPVHYLAYVEALLLSGLEADLFWIVTDFHCILHNLKDHATTPETPLIIKKLETFFFSFFFSVITTENIQIYM